MNNSIITQIQILKLSNIKPNFSELARQYDLDRRTIKKYYGGYKGKPKHHTKSSKLDEYYDIIKTKLALRGVNVRAVYEFIVEEISPDIGTYSNFNKYIKYKGLKPKKTEKGHPRYEKNSTIITTNTPFSKWGEIFGSVTLANAVLDRLLHHSTVISIKGPSYRLKDKRAFWEAQEAEA